MFRGYKPPEGMRVYVWLETPRTLTGTAREFGFWADGEWFAEGGEPLEREGETVTGWEALDQD